MPQMYMPRPALGRPPMMQQRPMYISSPGGSASSRGSTPRRSTPKRVLKGKKVARPLKKKQFSTNVALQRRYGDDDEDDDDEDDEEDNFGEDDDDEEEADEEDPKVAAQRKKREALASARAVHHSQLPLDIEKILSYRDDLEKKSEDFLVKYKGQSYLHVEWVPRDQMVQLPF